MAGLPRCRRAPKGRGGGARRGGAMTAGRGHGTRVPEARVRPRPTGCRGSRRISECPLTPPLMLRHRSPKHPDRAARGLIGG